jgi:TonB-linked SusC/RagA family outer membrane protein
VKDAPLETALDICFNNQPLTYSIVGTTIVIKQKSSNLNTDNLSPINVPPLIDVHGRLVDENGDAVDGASIKVKGTNIGTTTDFEGKFSLKGVAEDAILVFSAINIESFEKKLNGKNDLGTIGAKIKIVSNQEIIINQGYYSRKQRENTGNVTRVDGRDIQKQPVSDPLLALQARVPGLYVQQTSGVPGAYSTILLRGQNFIPGGTVNNISAAAFALNDPLFIVDGVPFSSASLSLSVGVSAVGVPNDPAVRGLGMSPFNYINPNDIESIEVLKDADATAIYGSRGANGVILITTKKAKSGQTKLEINTYAGFSKIASKFDLMNTQQWLQVRHEAFQNAGATPNPNSDFDLTYWDTTRYTDWQKVLIGNTARFSNIQVNLSGGNANTQFLIGGTYNKQSTVYPGHFKDTKGSIHLNLNHASSNKRLNVQMSVNYVNDNNVLPGNDFTSLINMAPDAPPVHDVNGNINWQLRNGNATWTNPFAAINNFNKIVTDNLIGNLNLSYEIVDGLYIRTSAGYNHLEANQINQILSSSFAPPANSDPNRRQNFSGTNDGKSWIIEPQINYHKQIGKGVFDALFGGTFQQNTNHSISTRASGFSSDALVSNSAAATSFSLFNLSNSTYRYNSIYGRIGYNYNEKYLINVTGRRDGSSRFGPRKQFGNFGAAGLGWIFSKEKFIEKNFNFLSFGKLRGSYGEAGSDAIADYQFLSTYTSNGYTYNGTIGLSPTILYNPDLHWQTVKKLEFGVELGFLNDGLNLSVSYYRNRAVDQLVQYNLTDITGFANIANNLPAIVENSGLEFFLSTTNIRTKNFSWISNINLTVPKNKLVSFTNLETSSYAFNYKIGKSLFSQLLYHYTGINQQTGLYNFSSTFSGDPIRPDFLKDQIFSRPITQQYYGGFQNLFQYRSIQLDFLVQFVKQTGKYSPDLGSFPAGMRRNSNWPIDALDHWTKAGDNVLMQKYSTNTGDPLTAYRNYLKSDGVITDASFIRLKNISISYQLSQDLLRRIHFQNLKIFIQAQNLFTITNYPGLDPETGNSLVLPPLRTITAGININL